MSGSVNKAILVGNVGRDPEIRSGATGKRVASFSLATSETWRDKATGERKEVTQWHNVVIFNDNLVKIAEQYVKKGSKLYLEGKIATREYTDRDGNPRKTTEIVLADFGGTLTLLDSAGGRPAPDPDAYGQARTRDPAPRQSTREAIDDDIPF